jgi:hypothetical protein
MKILAKHRNEPEKIGLFLRDLDRLASSMQVRGLYVNPRIERYGKILDAIDQDEDLHENDSPLQLALDEIVETKTALDGPIYQRGSARYVLLRLDDAISSGGATYDYPLISVEHVLPQTMDPNSAWTAEFDMDTHDSWVHRLGNLVLLTRRKNSQAQNYEFEVKKERYFSTAGGVSPFGLTTQVLQAPDWTVERLQQRQAELLGVLSNLWRL